MKQVSSIRGAHTRFECSGCGLSYDEAKQAEQCEWGHAHAFSAVVPRPVSDHAAAASEALRKFVKLLETGTAPEDIGNDVVLIGRMMARRV